MTFASPSTRGSVGQRLLAMLLVIVAVAMMMPSPASAHTGDQSYLYLDILDGTVEGRVEFPVSDINEVFDTDLRRDEEGFFADVESFRSEIVDYSNAHISVSEVGGNRLPLVFTEIEYLELSDDGYGIFHFEVDATWDTVPRQFDITFDPFFEVIDDYDAFLIIGVDFNGGVFDNEANWLLNFEQGSETQLADLDDASWWKGFKATVDLGVDHIRIGTDHIFFILVLLVPSVLFGRSVTNKWQPSETFGSSLWRVLKIATMFTIAHSITLTIVGLGVVDIPGDAVKWIEAAIAFSIVLAALHNLYPVFHDSEHLLAFGFGLFHGLGFAGLLSDLGLGRSNKVSSLLGFNVGVEIGQIAIILLVFPLLFVLRRTRWYQPFATFGSIALAFVAAVWTIERVTERDSGMSDRVDNWMSFPRILIPLALLYVVAAALHKRASDAGTLIDGGEGPDSTEDRETSLVGG